jgi:DnaJ-class molecular chaperone
MTKFAEPKFSVAAPLTESYAAGYARAFPSSLDEKACTECRGDAKVLAGGHMVECLACQGTGARAWQTGARVV